MIPNIHQQRRGPAGLSSVTAVGDEPLAFGSPTVGRSSTEHFSADSKIGLESLTCDLLTDRSAPRLAVAAAIALALVGCSRSASQDRLKAAPEAGFVVLQPQTVDVPIELAGRTAAYESSEVRPQVSGVIRARLFTEGSRVRRGQTLYQIDPSLYQASLSQARANLSAAEAQRSAAAAKAARYGPLARDEAISKQDYTDAAAAARQAAASVAQTRALIQTAQINLRFTRVPAPISGRIGRSLVTTGGLVTANQADPLTTIQRLDPMFVDIQQSSAQLLALRQASDGVARSGAAVRLILEDGTPYALTGTLQFAEAMVDPATGSVTIRARFPNPDGLLLPGMYVRASIVERTVANAFLVPQIGLSRDPQGRATVMLVGPGSVAVRRTVSADRTIGDKWLVTNGLRPGDKLIVEGLGKIRPNARVVPVPAGSRPRPTRDGEGGERSARRG